MRRPLKAANCSGRQVDNVMELNYGYLLFWFSVGGWLGFLAGAFIAGCNNRTKKKGGTTYE